MRTRDLSLLIGVLFLGVLFSANHALAYMKVEKAEWKQKDQKLEVKVKAKGITQIMALYGGGEYALKSDKKGTHYKLKLKPVCYSPEVTLVASSGEFRTVDVRAKGGNGSQYACSGGGVIATGDEGDDDEGDGGGTGGGGGGSNRDVVVVATNDLGMHCTCPGFSTFVLLPPFNTLRAQVFERVGENPAVLADPNDIRVEYNIVENSDAVLKADPRFQDWITNGPKLFPGYQAVRADGRVQGLTGATMSGEMTAKSTEGMWEVAGIPAYPVVTGTSKDIMTDPLGGTEKRDPYLTAEVKVYDQASGALLASTQTTVPVAFGGCCGCHLQVAQDYGYPATPQGSFQVMGLLHERDNGINIANIDIDGDGVGGPIRCSWCHVDPAMGESQAPGVPGHPEYPVSNKTFSEVLHGFHATSSAVAAYDPNIASDCYQCHPGNGVNCFRGRHEGQGLWCTDCHGDLNQRIAQGQLKKPWSDQTLPTCSQCHGDVGEGSGYLNMGIFGAYLNSRGHKHKVLCSTCHGEPHALYPAAARGGDNVQMQMLQGSDKPLGTCNVCHQGKNGYNKPPHDKGGFTNGTTGGSSGGGGNTGGGTIDAQQELQTTCLSCHGDRSGKVSCNNSKWLAHDGSRVSSAVFAAVSQYLTGSTCGSSGGNTGGGSTGGTIDAQQELQTTCLSCHGDKSRKVSCRNGDWLKHNGRRVSTAVFEAVSQYLTSSTCQGYSGGDEGDDD